MAVAIRLKRYGRRHRPFYRIEAIEKQNARGGKSLETLGYYDPMVADDVKKLKLNVERIQHWLDKGARPSDTVNSFLRRVDVNFGYRNTKRKSRRSAQRNKKRSSAE
ncbi:MAG TPA: 30S ribosomal protein S16 [Planctomycetes bacterium]|nr:30S ribosomal protein S16 [Planctomycetota bacterium]